MKKILFVNDYGYRVGGAESHLFAVKLALEQAGHQVKLLSSNSRAHGEDIQSDFQVSETGNFFNLDSYFSPKNYFDFRRIVANFKPDLVHYHNVLSRLSPAVVTAAGRIPSVMTLHDYRAICCGDMTWDDGSFCTESMSQGCIEKGCLKSRNVTAESCRYRLIKKAFGRVSTFIAPSNFLKLAFERAGFRNLEVLGHPHGVLQGTLDNSSSSTFLYLGRLAYQKGVDCLIRAMSNVVAGAPNEKLIIAGKGPEENALRALSEQLSLGGHVEFVGWVDEIRRAELFRKCLCLIVPSRWPEVAGLSMYEAAA